MNPEIKVELQVPDLWYDFYARVLPGTAFIAALRYVVLGTTSTPSVTEIIAILWMGYFSALLTQPLASRLTGWIERLAKTIAGEPDRLYIRRVQEVLGSDSRKAMILSKMHGEVAFFVQLGLLTLLTLLAESLAPSPRHPLGARALLFGALACAVLALDVAHRRLQRARDYSAVQPTPAAQPPAALAESAGS